MELERNWKNTLKLIALTILGIVAPIVIVVLIMWGIMFISVFFYTNFGEGERKMILTLIILTPVILLLIYASYDFALTYLIVKQKEKQDLDTEKKE